MPSGNAETLVGTPPTPQLDPNYQSTGTIYNYNNQGSNRGARNHVKVRNKTQINNKTSTALQACSTQREILNQSIVKNKNHAQVLMRNFSNAPTNILMGREIDNASATLVPGRHTTQRSSMLNSSLSNV